MSDGSDCFACRHYISSVGEKGYCRLYDHETSLPEKACLRYENKPVRTTEEAPVVHKSPDKKSRRVTYVLMIGALLSCICLAIIGLMFGVNLVTSVFTVDTIPPVLKHLTVVLIAAVFIFVCCLLFIFGRKYRWAMVLEIIFALAALIIMLLFSDSIIEAFHYYILKYIAVIFGA